MYITIDMGGTFVKYALVDTSGNIISKSKKPAPRTNLADLTTLLFSIIEEHPLGKVQGIAISCPGAVDTKNGIIYHGGSFPFLHKVNLAALIQEKYGKEVAIENDAKCAALAEIWLGSLQGIKDAVVLVLGSGVGGGIILNGKVRSGIHLSAGEVSYIIKDFCSDTKKARFFGESGSAVEMIRRIADMKQLKDRNDGKTVFQLINDQDTEATAVFDDYCLQLAAQILNLQSIIDPDCFAIGGGISAQPVLIKRINWAIEELQKHNPLLRAVKLQVVRCHFQNDANLYGALYHFLTNKEKITLNS